MIGGGLIMHSFHGISCNIHFNLDLSGEIIIYEKETTKEVRIEAQDILDFVAQKYIQCELIGKIESMSTRELLLGIDIKD